MTIYVYETMTQGDAATFASTDSLTFAAATAMATQVSVAPYTNNQGSSLASSGISLTFAGRNLVFSEDLAAASQSTATNGGIQFRDGSHLLIGNDDGTTLTVPTTASITSNVVYGLGGSDTINGGDGNNYLYGGTDDTPNGSTTGNTGDRIIAGNGNNHIYGNSPNTQQGGADGNDQIIVGSGSNYINGNAGNDQIFIAYNTGNGGIGGATGSNRVFGGAGNDTIYLYGTGNNSVNGNIGNDMILAYLSPGNDILRGGKGDDTIYASTGQTQLFGDADADKLIAAPKQASQNGDTVTYGHLTVMTGGTGNDTFDFASFYTEAGNAGLVQADGTHSGIVVGDTTYYQTITDFAQGEDTIALHFNVASSSDIVLAQDGVSFTSVSAAETYAQRLLDDHMPTATPSGQSRPNGEVAAIEVNGSTYLFYNHNGSGSIDSIIQMNGMKAAALSQDDPAVHSFTVG